MEIGQFANFTHKDWKFPNFKLPFIDVKIDTKIVNSKKPKICSRKDVNPS